MVILLSTIISNDNVFFKLDNGTYSTMLKTLEMRKKHRKSKVCIPTKLPITILDYQTWYKIKVKQCCHGQGK